MDLQSQVPDRVVKGEATLLDDASVEASQEVGKTHLVVFQ